MITAVRQMGSRGVGSLKLWVGENDNFVYGLVNIAAFLAQCMQETIQYDACDENNWSDLATVQKVGGTVYSSVSACGQLEQHYQDYKCSPEEDELAGARWLVMWTPTWNFGQGHRQAGTARLLGCSVHHAPGSRRHHAGTTRPGALPLQPPFQTMLT